PADRFIAYSLKAQLEALISDMLNDGIINVNKGELPADAIIVRNLQQHTERTINLSTVRDISEARQYARYRLSRNFYEDIANVGMEIFNQVIQPNLVYNQEKTQDYIEEA